VAFKKRGVKRAVGAEPLLRSKTTCEAANST